MSPLHFQPNPNPSLASWMASSNLSSRCCLEGYSGRSNWLKLQPRDKNGHVNKYYTETIDEKYNYTKEQELERVE